MTMSARIACASLFVLGLCAPSQSVASDEAPLDAKTAFARLKTLEGEWKLAGVDEHHGSKIIYKVTAAGSTVMETQMPGTNHEMVTMYHLDGKDLLVTHYCAAGNQPRMKLDLKGSKPDLYSFVFDGGTNLNPDKDMHIHSFRIAFLEGGKVESDWDAYMDGKKSMSSKFSLSRK